MYKAFKVIFLILLVTITGCTNNKYKTCKLDIDNKNDNYILNATYRIYYTNKYVTKIEKDEIYKSDDEDVLRYFNESKSIEYSNLNKLYGGYNYTIKLLNNGIIIKSTIDTSSLNVNKMIKNNFIIKEYTFNNKITLNGIKYIYTSKGFECNI